MYDTCKPCHAIGVLFLLMIVGTLNAQPQITSIKASSFFGGKIPANAFDGKPGTSWQASAGTGWISCDFKKEVELTGITTLVNKSHCMDIRIQVRSSKAGAFQTIASCKGFSGFDNDGKWDVRFEAIKALEVRTVIDHCTHRNAPNGSGEWPYIYEQSFTTNRGTVSPKSVAAEMAPDLPVCVVPLVKKKSIKLDGKLDEPQWANATFVSNFSWEGKLVPNQSIVRVFATKSRLYIGATLYEPQMDKIKAEYRKDSFHVWSDDCMEVFVAPAEEPSAYTQVAINSNGAKLVQSHRKAGRMPSNFKVAAKREKNYWTIETAIPFSVAGIARVKAGDAIRINFCRNATVRKQYSTWSAMFGGFHKPNRFGKMRFVDGEGFSSLGIEPLRFTFEGRVEASVKGSEAARVQVVVDDVVKDEVKVHDQEQLKVALKPEKLPCTLQLRISDRNDKRIYRTARVTLQRDEAHEQAKLLSGLLREIEEGLTQTRSDALNKRFDGLRESYSKVRSERDAKSKLENLAVLKRKASDLRLDVSAEAANQPAVVSFATAMKKLLPGQPWAQPLRKKSTIHTARRDYESAQVIVFARKSSLRNIRVIPSDFINESGLRFKGKINLYNVETVNWPAGSGTRVLPGNIYPDPLIPHKRFDLKSGQSKAVWFEVETPVGIAAGDYNGELKVVWDGGGDSLKLRIRVYPVTLPKTHTLHTPFVISPRYVAEGHGLEMGSQAFRKMLEKYRKFNVRYKLDWLYFDGDGSCQQTLYPKCIKDGSEFRWDFSEFDRKMQQYFDEGMRSFSVGLSWAHLPKTVLNPDGSVNGKYSGCPMGRLSAEELRAFQKALAEYAEHLKAKGWFDKAYYYVADEPRAEHYDTVREHAKFLLDSDAGWKTMVTAMCPSLGDVFKIWCPNVAFFDPKLSQQQIASGKEVWWYVCVGRYHPNYYVDYESIDPRIHFWLTYRYGVTGVLYWRVNHYGKGSRFEKAVDGGDGYIFYPGQDGPLPSIRAMMIRDGIEDYDLLKMLEKQAPDSTLLDLDNVCKSLSDYTSDPEVLQQRRIAILHALSRLDCNQK